MATHANIPPALAGPRKLICIHSGTCDYAEVDISSPVQLVAANNVGKTAFISALQFLYIDDARHLDFGSHSLADSREFYFRNTTSYILFECDTPVTGIITIFLRSAGPATNFEIERYWYRGAYQRDDFIDPDTNAPRPFDQIRPRLSDRDFLKITSNEEYRGLLGAVEHRTEKTWGLVTIEDAKRYRDFTKTFQRLLQLKDLTQDQLKDLLADCANIRPQHREIDLAKTATAHLETIERNRNEISLLETSTPQINEARTLHQREIQSRALAHHLTKLLRARCASWNEEYDRRIRALNETADRERARLEELKESKRLLDAEQSQHERAIGVCDEKLASIEKGRELYADYLPDLNATMIQNLKDEWLALDARIRNQPEKNKRQLEAEKSQVENAIRQTIRQIEAHGKLLVTWLRDNMDDAEVSALGAVFNADLLNTVIDGGVQINDAQKFLATLRQITEKCDVRGYENPSIVSLSFPPGAISKASEIGRLETFKAQLETHKANLKKIEKDLETLLQYDTLKKQSDEKRIAYEKAKADHDDYLAWERELQTEASLREEKQNHETRSETIRNELTSNENARQESQRQIDQNGANGRELKNANTHITAQIKNGLPVADGDNPGFVPDPLPSLPDELRDWFVPVRQSCDNHRGERESLAQKMALLDTRFASATFPYDTSADVTERLDRLEQEIAALDERRRNLDNEWMALLRTSRSSFDTILKSLDSLHRKCRELNKQLATLKFSSIHKIDLILHERADEVSTYKRYGQQDGEASLFDTPADAKRQLETLKTHLQNRPKLQLSQLYGLRFEITRNDGKKNIYDDFAQIESTGTTVVLKVILNLIVLNDLRIAKKSRIPFYLDEVAELDQHNLSNILSLSEQLGFIGIFAAPETAIGLTNYVFMVPSENEKSRLVVDERHVLQKIPQ